MCVCIHKTVKQWQQKKIVDNDDNDDDDDDDDEKSNINRMEIWL